MNKLLFLVGLFLSTMASVYANSDVETIINFDNSSVEKKDDFSIKLGGYIDFQSAHISQSDKYNDLTFLKRQDGSLINNPFHNQEFIFRTDSRFYLTANRQVDETFSYGGVIVFNSLINQNEDEAGKIAEQNYVFTKLNHGKLEAGAMYGSAAKMRVDSLNLARATGGVSGSWWRFSSLGHASMAGMSPVFILQPMLPNEHGFTTSMGLGSLVLDGQNIASVNSHQPLLGWGSRSNRFSYYTPKLNGYQFGITYSPNTGNTGTLGANSQSSYLGNLYGNDMYRMSAAMGEGNITNYTSAGVTKESEISEDLSVKMSLTSEFGQWDRISMFNGQSVNNSNFFSRNDLQAYSTGMLVAYKNYGLSLSYSDWGNSLLATYANGNSMFEKDRSYYFNSGLSAVYEKVAISLTQLKSSFGGNELNAWSLSFDIKPDFVKDKGIIFYIEGTWYELRSSSVYSPKFGTQYSDLNDGYVVLFGIKMVF